MFAGILKSVVCLTKTVRDKFSPRVYAWVTSCDQTSNSMLADMTSISLMFLYRTGFDVWIFSVFVSLYNESCLVSFRWRVRVSIASMIRPPKMFAFKGTSFSCTNANAVLLGSPVLLYSAFRLLVLISCV